jgi:hypothetical protein
MYVQRSVCCSLLAQDGVIFEACADSARAWHCSDASAFPTHLHHLMHMQPGGSALSLDICCPSPDGHALIVIVAHASDACADYRTMLLQRDGSVAPFWSYTAPLPPTSFLAHSLAVPQAPSLEINALLPPAAAPACTALAPAVLYSFNTARSTAQQRLFSHVLCHLLAEQGCVSVGAAACPQSNAAFLQLLRLQLGFLALARASTRGFARQRTRAAAARRHLLLSHAALSGCAMGCAQQAVLQRPHRAPAVRLRTARRAIPGRAVRPAPPSPHALT